MVVQTKDPCLVYASGAIPSSEAGLYRRIKGFVQNSSGAIVDHDGFERVRDARWTYSRPLTHI